MKLSKEYIAGFFDGEGSVYAYTRNSPKRKAEHKRPSRSLVVTISQVQPGVLEALKEEYGGSIYGKQRDGNHQKLHQWVLSTRPSERFLRDILPFVIIKRAVVEAGLEFLEIMKRPRAERCDYSNMVIRNGRRRVAPVIRPEFEAEMLAKHAEIRRLNLRGAPANATRVHPS